MTAQTPEQDSARPSAGADPSPGADQAGPQDSRRIRRRLAFTTAETLEEEAPSPKRRARGKNGRAKGAVSPWLRAEQAWRRAGLSWQPSDDADAAASGAEPAPEAESKAEPEPRPKPAAKAAPKPEPKTEPKTERKSAPKSRTEPKSTTDAKSASQSTGDSKGKADAKAEAQTGSKSKAAPKTETEDSPKTRAEKAEPEPAPASERQSAERAKVAAGARGALVGAGAAVGVAVVVAVAAGVHAVGSGDGGAGPAAPAAVAAERLFGADPAGTDGLVQELSAVAASGGTVVAVGGEQPVDDGAGRERAQFLVSGDAGLSWRLARVKAANGDEPAPGDRPRLVAGGSGRWVALGEAAAPSGTAPGTAVWTSRDGGVWTREAASASAAFRPGDRISALARTPSGFVAAGAHSPTGRFRGDQRAVLWTSADGRSWRRLDRPGGGEITELDRVAALGNGGLVAHGRFDRKAAKTVKGKGKRRQRTVVRRGEGLWVSPDGGRTWTQVALPRAQGAYGPVIGPVAGPGGVYVVREGRRVAKGKKRRAATRYGVVFASADGRTWTPSGQVSAPSYRGVARLAGTSAGLAVLVRGKGGAGTVLRSGDGRSWRVGGGIGAMGGGSGTGLAVNGLTVAAGAAAVLAGRRGDDPYLALSSAAAARPVTTVDLTGVPGVIRPERTVTSMSAAAGRVVAVGSTGGGGAVWSAPAADPDAWTRARISGAGAAVGGPGRPRQRFGDVVHGPKGWLAVGRVTAPDGKTTPLAAQSADGAAWRRTRFPGAKDALLEACASGPSGYVVVGSSGGKIATWRSADLTRWKRGAGAGKGDLRGPAWMRDVAATSKGYVAVGGRRATGGAGRGRQAPATYLPAVWTSRDGGTWSAAAPPPLPSGIVSGAFHQVVARGDLLVGFGWGSTAQAPGAPARWLAFTGVSTDGGRTWRTSVPPGAEQGAEITSSAVTPKGFAAAGTVGRPGAQDAAMWASPDGVAWRRVPAHGHGLDGPGDQRFTALAAVGGDVLAVGVDAGHRGETPVLWRTAAP
ncbi:hypothetical protein Arub01_06700 [Actinomadura rubrobrunea]|uniref:Uncharacterized protein n=1 Tax=Actinomadura rubrobrunea TaxID=115335 RepID=A0A9W6PSI7_9ACTN|nr:hypothetical protein [Actinomadura rubrobrunea]GLW62426.1 hypothetical protein Arub01_06700 [Actinomadura rubrobrunea]